MVFVLNINCQLSSMHWFNGCEKTPTTSETSDLHFARSVLIRIVRAPFQPVARGSNAETGTGPVSVILRHPSSRLTQSPFDPNQIANSRHVRTTIVWTAIEGFYTLYFAWLALNGIRFATFVDSVLPFAPQKQRYFRGAKNNTGLELSSPHLVRIKRLCAVINISITI